MSRTRDKNAIEISLKNNSAKLKAVTPNNLNEALKLISKKSYLIMAGGTNLGAKLDKNDKTSKLLHIENLPELHGIEIFETEIIIGSGVKIKNIIENPNLKNLVPILIDACKKTENDKKKETATIGGNIVNAASKTEIIPALTNYGAMVILESIRGKRTFSVNDFIIDASKTEIKKDEILTKIIIPRQS